MQFHLSFICKFILMSIKLAISIYPIYNIFIIFVKTLENTYLVSFAFIISLIIWELKAAIAKLKFLILLFDFLNQTSLPFQTVNLWLILDYNIKFLSYFHISFFSLYRMEWVEIIEPKTGDHMFTNLRTGQCYWEPPQGAKM